MENVAEMCYVSTRDFPSEEPGSLGEGMARFNRPMSGRSKRRRGIRSGSGRVPVIEVEQAPERLPLLDATPLVGSFDAGKGNDAVDALMRSFDAEKLCEKLIIEFHGLTTRTNHHSLKSGKQKGNPGTTWEHSTVPSGRETC